MTAPQQVYVSRCIRMLISALTAGIMAGLISYSGEATIKTCIVCGLITAIKDVQSYLSTSPMEPHHPELTTVDFKKPSIDLQVPKSP